MEREKSIPENIKIQRGNFMIKKEDVMELHSQIHMMKEKQKRVKKLIEQLVTETEEMDNIIEGLEYEYHILKRKGNIT